MCLCLVFWVVFLSQLNSHFLSTRRPIFIPPTCSSSSFIVSELLSQWVKKKSVRKKQYYRISHTKAHFIGLRPLYEVNFLEKKIPKALYEYYHLRDDDDSFVWLVIIVCRNVQQKKRDAMAGVKYFIGFYIPPRRIVSFPTLLFFLKDKLKGKTQYGGEGSRLMASLFSTKEKGKVKRKYTTVIIIQRTFSSLSALSFITA